MNVVLLSANENMTIQDAALYALVGFVIVLLVLALLVGIFYLMGFIFKSMEKSKAQKQEATAPQTAVTESNEDDEELFAVISAVISAIYDEESAGTEKPEFVIRKISRK